MAIQTLDTIKEWFKTGFKPKQQQFWDTWDSFRHKYEKVPVQDIEGIDELFSSKADKKNIETHLEDSNAHSKLIEKKLDKGDYTGTAKDLLNAIPDLNTANLKLGGYPATRNDGLLLTNKALSTDENGNLKLYKITAFPKPHIKHLKPDSYPPETTGNIRIFGDFFTPEMCDLINNPNAIHIGGLSAIHYATFLSSQEILINVTTENTEGTFTATLNNGMSAIKTNAFSIILGTVFSPTESDWKNVVNTDVSIKGELSPTLFATDCSAILDVTKIPIKANTNFRLQCNYGPSPLGTDYNGSSIIELYRSSDDAKIFTLSLNSFYSSGYSEMHMRHHPTSEVKYFDFSNNNFNEMFTRTFRFKRVGTTFFYGFNEHNRGSFTATENTEMYAKFITSKLTILKIKYIETK